ncbi:MAG: DUF2752 domain-containing protein [Planctomycetota bacterium]|jgi:hypothetical protein
MQLSQQLNKSKFFCRASHRQRATSAVIFLIVLAFFGLLSLAAHYKISLSPYGCGFKQKYDLPCPSCGMTTSVFQFVRGEIFGYNGALYIQPAAVLLCSVLVVVALLAFIIAVFGVYFGFIKRILAEVKIRYIILALVIIIIAGWAVTLSRALAAR